MAYKNISYQERKQIRRLLNSGKSNSEIAQILGRHRSTIGREIKRNTGNKGYLPKTAMEASARRKRTAVKSRKITKDVQTSIKYLLNERLTVEKVAESLAKNHVTQLHANSVYRFIREDRRRHGVLFLRLRNRLRYCIMYGFIEGYRWKDFDPDEYCRKHKI